MHIFNVFVTYLQGMMAPREVDFIKYALWAIIHYVQWSKIGKVKNVVNMLKIFFHY